MKRVYVSPKIKKVDFCYDTQVVAKSDICSGEIYVANGSSCGSLRLGKTKSAADPCYYETDYQQS